MVCSLQYFDLLQTLDIIGRCAFNYDIGALQDEKSPYVQAVYETSELVFGRYFMPFIGRWDWSYRLTSSGRRFFRNLKTIHELPNRIIKERREMMKNPVIYYAYL